MPALRPPFAVASLLASLFAASGCGPVYGPVQMPPTMQLRVGGCAPLEGKSHLVGGGPTASRLPMDSFTYDVVSSDPAVARTQHGTGATRPRTVVFAHAAGQSELVASFTAPETGKRDTRRVTVTVAGEEDRAGRDRCAALAKELTVEENGAK